jgi:hypothetical protein
MNMLFGRHRGAKICEPDTDIRSTFSQEVLDLEVELNFTCSVENISALMELYTQAIEFYLPLKSPKLHYYHEKMQKLLSRTDVLSVLNQQNTSEVASEKDKTVNKFSTHSGKLPLERSCEKVIQNHHQNSSSITKEIVENLRSQNETLNARLEYRKKMKNGKSPGKKSHEISGGEEKMSLVDLFEAEVERIMENFVEEKTRAKKEIEEKYREYVLELEGMEGEIMQKVLKEVRYNMKAEIEHRFKEIEDNRNQAMASARKRFMRK